MRYFCSLMMISDYLQQIIDDPWAAALVNMKSYTYREFVVDRQCSGAGDHGHGLAQTSAQQSLEVWCFQGLITSVAFA